MTYSEIMDKYIYPTQKYEYSPNPSYVCREDMMKRIYQEVKDNEITIEDFVNVMEEFDSQAYQRGQDNERENANW